MNEAIQATGMVETSEDKHTSLNRAIKDIQNVLDQVNAIKRRVSGEDGPPIAEVEKIRDTTTLLEVLNSGSTRINDTVSQIHQSLKELEEALF